MMNVLSPVPACIWHCAVAKISLEVAILRRKPKMYSTRNISNGFSKFLNCTTVLTTPFARNIPAVAVKHKEPILKDTKSNYAAPTGNLSVTTNLLGKKNCVTQESLLRNDTVLLCEFAYYTARCMIEISELFFRRDFVLCFRKTHTLMLEILAENERGLTVQSVGWGKGDSYISNMVTRMAQRKKLRCAV